MANVRSFAGQVNVQWQPSLLAPEPGFDATFSRVRRVDLDASAWFEHTPGWVEGADELFAQLVDDAPWVQRRVHMYERELDEPRLTAWHGTPPDDPNLPALIAPMARMLSTRYQRDFDSVGAALYRDGHDSVAWHGDRIDPAIIEPVVALISLGSPRLFRLRSKARPRASASVRLLPGDLLVMGGTAQRSWEHSIPKVARAGPRLSLQFRHSQ